MESSEDANHSINDGSLGSAEPDDDYHSISGVNVPSECDLCVLADQRIFYLHHRTKKSYWEPPRISWNCHLGLPYGWEEAVDAFGAQYFINHLAKTTTYEDPRQGSSVMSTVSTDQNESESTPLHSIELPETPPLRTYEIHRHASIGFGFVAASQHPVVIQFVTLGGPSDGKLLANDQIIEVNGVDVSGQGKDEVVSMIRGSASPLTLTVGQLPPKQKTGKRRNCRVRFQDCVNVSNCDPNDCLPVIPNVVRVFLENGQTKSFKYDQTTTVQDVLNNLAEKLQIKDVRRFTLASEQAICTRSPRLTLLQNDHLLCKLASSPAAQSSRCRFRLTYVPPDVREYAMDDIHAFNYLYEQCVNDVVAGRFSYEMRYEACVRLAALHLRQVAIDTGSLKADGRASVSRMEKEYGLATFLPTILLENVKRKEIRKHLRFYLKKDDDDQPQTHCHNGISPRSCTSMKKCSFSEELPSFSGCSMINDAKDVNLGLRLKYVQIVSHLPTFGGRCFSVTFKQTHMEMVMQVDPVQGLLVRHPGKMSQPTIQVDFDLIDRFLVIPDTDILRVIIVKLRNTGQQGMEFLIDKDDINDLIQFVSGYCVVIHNREIPFEYIDNPNDESLLGANAPVYHGTHFVYPAGWNYSSEMKLGVEVMVNFMHDPPPYNQALGATTFYNDGNPTDEPDTERTDISCNGNGNGTDSSPEKLKQKIESLDFPKFIDEPSPSESPRIGCHNDTSPSRMAKLLHVTDSFWSHHNNHQGTSKFRDSIRVHKQRHSVPNGTTPKASPRRMRRISSSSDTDCSQSPAALGTESQTVTTTNSPMQAERVVVPRPTHIMRDFLTARPVNVIDHQTVSFGLNSPDQLPQISESRLAELFSPSDFGKNHVENLLTLFPDRVCTDSEIIDLTDIDSEERKHVRFNFAECPAPPKPPRTFSGPKVEIEDIDENNGDHAPLISKAPGKEALSGVKLRSLTTSKTFPMGDRELDFGDDFVPRTYAAARKEWDAQLAQTKPQVRRMSLKEFTGLEATNAKGHRVSMSPLLTRLHHTSISNHQGANLLDKFCIRRRSSSGLSRNPSDGFGQPVTHRFEIAPDTAPVAPRLVAEPIDFEKLDERLAQMRGRLSKTLLNIPNESPRKRQTVDAEKSKLMDELSRLAFGCKSMVRATTLQGPSEELWRGIVLDTVDSADNVTDVAESILRKSNSLYQAQLMTSKTDQMLRALIETVHDMHKAYVAPQYGDEAKQLVRSSTTLAATLNQLIQSVQGL